MGLGHALHGFGGHLQTGQNLHLFTATIRGRLLTHQGMHPAHSRRKLRVLDVQFGIHRKLADVTLAAQVIGARQAYWTNHRQNRFGADFLILGVMATGAWQLTLIGRRSFELQQLV